MGTEAARLREGADRMIEFAAASERTILAADVRAKRARLCEPVNRVLPIAASE